MNKPSKAIWRKCWIKYASSIVETFSDENSHSSFKLPVLTHKNVIDWVKEGLDHLFESPEMVKSLFEVCGISSSYSLKCVVSLSINSAWKGHCVTWRPR